MAHPEAGSRDRRPDKAQDSPDTFRRLTAYAANAEQDGELKHVLRALPHRGAPRFSDGPPTSNSAQPSTNEAEESFVVCVLLCVTANHETPPLHFGSIAPSTILDRSEERRVGKEGRSRPSP